MDGERGRWHPPATVAGRCDAAFAIEEGREHVRIAGEWEGAISPGADLSGTTLARTCVTVSRSTDYA
jgi:hypothetical protein